MDSLIDSPCLKPENSILRSWCQVHAPSDVSVAVTSTKIDKLRPPPSAPPLTCFLPPTHFPWGKGGEEDYTARLGASGLQLAYSADDKEAH
ncbi:hypothetical protein BaRGS_00019908 [Batillaria attramentaria]|uniref:Uncharacterized protein n=1 Tax=Batillaria attramentaria TaxID=370345 RepID=A0ABD0KPC9_9CAEN